MFRLHIYVEIAEIDFVEVTEFDVQFKQIYNLVNRVSVIIESVQYAVQL